MADTIEWLEIIGKTAKLRHARGEELANTLAPTDASDALKSAVISEDSSRLSVELGNNPMKTDHNINGPSHEEEEPDDDDDKQPPSKPHKPEHDGRSFDR